MQDSNMNYANIANTCFNNLKIKDTTFVNSYMQDTVLKNVKFDNIDFTKSQIFNTHLKRYRFLKLYNTRLVYNIAMTLKEQY